MSIDPNYKENEHYYYAMLIEELWKDAISILDHPLRLKEIDCKIDPNEWLENLTETLHPNNLLVMAAQELSGITYEQLRREIDSRIHSFKTFLREEWD